MSDYLTILHLFFVIKMLIYTNLLSLWQWRIYECLLLQNPKLPSASFLLTLKYLLNCSWTDHIVQESVLKVRLASFNVGLSLTQDIVKAVNLNYLHLYCNCYMIWFIITIYYIVSFSSQCVYSLYSHTSCIQHFVHNSFKSTLYHFVLI